MYAENIAQLIAQDKTACSGKYVACTKNETHENNALIEFFLHIECWRHNFIFPKALLWR